MGSLDEVHRSLWIADTPATDFPALDGRVEVDVAVVGGGITGLTTALLLARAGHVVALVEAGRIASGATGYTSAKVSSLQGLIYADLLEAHGEETARVYADASQAGLAQVGAFCEEDGIDAGLEWMPAFTYVVDETWIPDVEREAGAARRIGLPASLTTDTDLPYPVAAAVRVEDQAVFHPRRYCLGLARLLTEEGGRIFERTTATDIVEGDPCTVSVPGGELRAAHVVQATQLPFHDPGGFFGKTSPSRSYCIAVRVDGAVPEGMYLSGDTPTRSIRPHRSDGRTYLVLGGEGHKVGQDPDTRGRYEALERWATQTFGVQSIDHRWSAQDYVSADGLPYVGRLSPRATRLWVATGFRKWGMTSGTAAAMLLTDLISGRHNPWAQTFDATRLKLGTAAKKLLRENADVARRFVGDRFAGLTAPDAEGLAPGEGGIAKLGGGTVAAYRDEHGRLHARSPKCTHLGCLVAFNTAERTWDCPCHGSRFAIDGSVIQGPALEDLPAAGS
jgi:glycine/D-amino acid oxidase-like deaminating enzyme/nitrite reductase/ring-hydroxylating ferredoxin subunit